MAYYSKIAQDAPVYATFGQYGTAAAAGGTVLFVSDGHYTVDHATMVHGLAAGAGATATLRKAVPGVGATAGVEAATAYPLDGPVNEPVVLTLSDTEADRTLAPGDRLVIHFSGTQTGLATFGCSARLKRVRPLP